MNWFTFTIVFRLVLFTAITFFSPLKVVILALTAFPSTFRKFKPILTVWFKSNITLFLHWCWTTWRIWTAIRWLRWPEWLHVTTNWLHLCNWLVKWFDTTSHLSDFSKLCCLLNCWTMVCNIFEWCEKLILAAHLIWTAGIVIFDGDVVDRRCSWFFVSSLRWEHTGVGEQWLLNSHVKEVINLINWLRSCFVGTISQRIYLDSLNRRFKSILWDNNLASNLVFWDIKRVKDTDLGWFIIHHLEQVFLDVLRLGSHVTIFWKLWRFFFEIKLKCLSFKKCFILTIPFKSFWWRISSSFSLTTILLLRCLLFLWSPEWIRNIIDFFFKWSGNFKFRNLSFLSLSIKDLFGLHKL